MKLCIDGSILLAPRTGIGRYVYENSLRLSCYKTLNITYYYGYFSDILLETPLQSPLGKVRNFIVTRPWLKRLARLFIIKAAQRGNEIFDLYWQGNFIPNPGIKANKTVCTIHDFSFLHDSQWHPAERVEYMKKHLPIAADTSDLILTGSDYTKQEIIQQLGIPPEKIRVIYHGIDHRIFRVYDKTPLNFSLPEKFLLFVGSIEPRKNLLTFLKAYTSMEERFKMNFPLVLIGFKGWDNQEVMELIHLHHTYIHYLGFLSDQELAYVYNMATVFVYPSLYEGFGLPPLEAMACGTPVIVSNTSSMPEVCGDGAYYIDPISIESIAKAIMDVTGDEILQQSLREKGLKRASQFTWEKAAEEHHNAFTSLMSKTSAETT